MATETRLTMFIKPSNDITELSRNCGQQKITNKAKSNGKINEFSVAVCSSCTSLNHSFARSFACWLAGK